jgi:hypothetical protein
MSSYELYAKALVYEVEKSSNHTQTQTSSSTDGGKPQNVWVKTDDVRGKH